MCEPASIVMIVAAAGALYSTEQQRQQAKSANKAADIQYKVDSKRARDEAMDRENQLSQDALVESTRLNQERSALALDALREQAGVRIGSAEGGLGGVSKVRSFLSVGIQEDLARSDIDTNSKNAQFNLAQAQRGIESQAHARKQNAFLTRQANQQYVPGALDFAVNATTAAASSYTPSRGAKSSAAPVPTFQEGQVIDSARPLRYNPQF